MKLNCTVTVLGLLASACAELDQPSPAPATTAQRSSELTCEPQDDSYCDPNSYCDLGSTAFFGGQYVACADGLTMFAWATPDCRWCIDRDACAAHSGPTICPH
jgi:hypothetical protein